MGFKLKSLVAAVAVAAFAGHAAAAINNVNAAAGSDVLFFAINSDGASFIYDLGVQADNFGASVNHNYTIGSAYASFVGGSSDTGSITWGVAAAKAGSTFVKYALSTVQAGADTSGLLNSSVGSATNASNGPVYSVISTASSAQLAVAGTTGIYTTATAANWAAYSGSDFGANYTFATDNAVGTTDVAFIKATLGGAGAAGTAAVQTTLAGTFAFDGAALSYVAAVPEPETYGMLVAGLLMLGAVARRRAA